MGLLTGSGRMTKETPEARAKRLQADKQKRYRQRIKDSNAKTEFKVICTLAEKRKLTRYLKELRAK